jgi:hypothetical protein
MEECHQFMEGILGRNRMYHCMGVTLITSYISRKQGRSEGGRLCRSHRVTRLFVPPPSSPIPTIYTGYPCLIFNKPDILYNTIFVRQRHTQNMGWGGGGSSSDPPDLKNNKVTSIQNKSKLRSLNLLHNEKKE